MSFQYDLMSSPWSRIHQRTAISTIITKPAALLQMTYEWPNRLYWQGFQPLILWLHLAKIHFTNALYQAVNYTFFQLSNACWIFLHTYGTIFTLYQMFCIHWMLASIDFTVLVLCLLCLIDASAKAKHMKSSWLIFLCQSTEMLTMPPNNSYVVFIPIQAHRQLNWNGGGHG